MNFDPTPWHIRASLDKEGQALFDKMAEQTRARTDDIFNQLKANNEVQKTVADATSKMVVQVVRANENLCNTNAGVHLNRVQLMEFYQIMKAEDKLYYDHRLQEHGNGE